MCVGVCVLLRVFPYSQPCKCSFMLFFQTFVFLIYFTSKGHMESWGHSSIWALIEGETDKQRDKEKERERERKRKCVCVCAEGAGIQSTSVQ